ncbi:MAG TPA: class I SAM-dependent methyltransferase [Ktedonosporobacter sp.]|nr:class I SAM-dependent methyltransferase [Ktedonosporobacter sp.]
MPNPLEPEKKDYPNTYFVQDRSSQDEMTRLRIQDQMLTTAMGGVLPEQADPPLFRRVLDVGCGTGGWLIEVAKAYPNISLLIGVDASRKMVDYARSQAEALGVSDRVEFHVMDALLILAFPDNYFDLVNQRCAGSWIRTWEWPKLFSEYQRVCRGGGTIRITEPGILHESNSPALTRFFEMFQCAMFRSGHLFRDETTGIIAHLPDLLTRYGIQDVQSKAYALEYHAGTATGEAYYQNTMHFFRNLRPFFQKWGCDTADYETIYQQCMKEVQQSDFYSTWDLLTVWGTSWHNENSRRD